VRCSEYPCDVGVCVLFFQNKTRDNIFLHVTVCMYLSIYIVDIFFYLTSF